MVCTPLAFVAFEIAWRISRGFPSPAMGVLYAVVAVLTGRATSPDVPRRSVAAEFIAGSIVLTIVFAALTAMRLVHVFAWAAALLASAGVVRARRRRLVGRVRAGDVAAGLAIAVLVARAVYYADRLPLGAPHPSGFAWIDTPFWLTLAYGVERGLPLPDLLFSGGTVQYHCGAFVAVACVRRLTGVPMHVAYVITAFTHALALCMLLGETLPRWFGVRSRLARTAVALAGVGWLEYLSLNASTLVGTAVGLFVLLELALVRRWHGALRATIALVALAMVKEVQLAMVILIALVATGAVFVRTRRWLPLAALAAGATLSFALQRVLYHSLEHVSFAVHRPHLFTDFLADELERAAPWVALGGAGLVVTVGLRRRVPVLERAAFAGFACYLAGLVAWNVFMPVLAPPRTPLATEWVLADMAQFSNSGRQVMVVALLLGAIAAWIRLARPTRRARGALLAPAAFAAVFGLWRAPAQGPWRDRPEEHGDDPIVPLLARIDPRSSLVAADRLNWNEENPHWAAFFGHRFFVLRTGRWTTAYPEREPMLADQKVLFETADEAQARLVVQRRHITHLVEDRARPVPWLASHPPSFENAQYRVHVLARDAE